MIARLARSRPTRNDVMALNEFLNAHPDILKAVAKRPGQLVNADFLIAHPALGQFFETHPALSSVLLQRAERKEKGKATPATK